MLSAIFDNLGLIAAGGGGAAATVVGIKGVPASLAWAKAWWSKGKADAVALKGGLAALEQRVAALEQKGAPIAPAPAQQNQA